MKRVKFSVGFTLIELLIVVAIIGILAAIAVPNFLNAQLRAKIARVESELKAVGEGYTMYFMDRNAWPPHLDGNPAQHRFITTPIPYMASSVVDVFQPQRGELNFNTYFQGQYHAEPATTHHQRISHKEVYDRTWNVAFFMTSVGPARIHQARIIFDVSNGLRSNGDILRFTYGNNNGEYPFAKKY